MKIYKVHINDRNYGSWTYYNTTDFQHVELPIRPDEYKLFSSQRTMKAGGGLTEDEKEPDVVTSNVDFGGTTTPIKPVEKLDYATLRDRLPKEINDQVVQLLASSEQALQDFAYITSQNDVNNFNVKYGVNLIIPPAQQTS